ncbi:MAG: NAD(+)/NADH kinase [Gammaproteobacteria bacterium]|nr:NAD(+)/NADH kinase [Gammaproteobacteria bacterium]MBU1441154.1 NAD(+)/NADH kinase [Gammaproteobacteria bacterium]
MNEPRLASPPPLFIVFNVRSGRGGADAVRATIDETCKAANRRYEILTVEKASDLHERAREAVERAQAEGGVVVVAGGDGTINAVAQHVVEAGCAFGVLPQGTFNYFSRTHGISSDTGEALAALIASQPQPVQVGMVNERLFLVNASVGLYAKLLEEREAFKSRYGRSRRIALVAALSTLLLGQHPLWDLRVDWRGREWNLRTPTLFVGNNALQFEQLGMPEAEALDEGELAAIALKPVGFFSMLWLMTRGAVGRLSGAKDITSLTFKSITLDFARKRRKRRAKVAADGEIEWMDMPLHFRVGPKPLWLVKPEHTDPEARA